MNALRAVGRGLAIIVVVAAGLATLLFVAVAIDHDDGDQLLGGIVLSVLSTCLAVGAWVVQRRLRPADDRAAAQTAATREAPEGREEPRAASADLQRAQRGETVQLRPSPLKWSLILLGSLAFTAILAAMAVSEPQVISVGGALFFGLCAIVALWALIPGAMYLRVSPQGFVARTLLRTFRFSWNEVENFQVFEIRHRYGAQRLVGFDLRERTPERQSFWQTVNRGMSGVDVGLPDNYGEDPERLADTLNRLRERFASEHGPSPSELADRRLAEEAARVDTSRRVAITWLVALACVGAFVLEVSRYDLAPSAAQLDDIGGASRHAAWWTLLSANLLHADLVHIVLNLIAWCIIGALLEREIGWVRMACLCLIGGVAATGLSVVVHPGSVTVGLSGIVFAALAWGVLRDVHRTRALGSVAWGMLPLGVIYTFVIPGTSIGGHLGGLAAGLVLGYTLDRARTA